MGYRFLQFVLRVFFKLFFRAEIIGRENVPTDGGIILAANHTSNFDPPLLAAFLRRPVSYMAKQELFDVPIFGRAITGCHAFPVKRGAADRGAIKTAIKVVKMGNCLGLFPEGTRSKDGAIHKPEAGIALIAAMTTAPVVPAALIGTDKIFQKGSYFPKLRVVYGKPIIFEGKHNNKEDLQVFSQKIMDKIDRMIKLNSNNM
ncbi:MAG: lysophospholipid acyltransferase family protein [Selenomonadaceae bacterium]